MINRFQFFSSTRGILDLKEYINVWHNGGCLVAMVTVTAHFYNSRNQIVWTNIIVLLKSYQTENNMNSYQQNQILKTYI